MVTKNMVDVTIVGVNYHNAPLEVRNKFAFSPSAIQNIYKEAKHALRRDFFILSTLQSNGNIYDSYRRTVPAGYIYRGIRQ